MELQDFSRHKMKRFYEDLELRSFVVLHYLNTILIECVTFAFKSVFFQQLTVQSPLSYCFKKMGFSHRSERVKLQGVLQPFRTTWIINLKYKLHSGKRGFTYCYLIGDQYMSPGSGCQDQAQMHVISDVKSMLCPPTCAIIIIFQGFYMKCQPIKFHS